jgi:hypothetical protein
VAVRQNLSRRSDVQNARYPSNATRQGDEAGASLLAAIRVLDEHGHGDAVDVVRASLRTIDHDAYVYDMLRQAATEWAVGHDLTTASSDDAGGGWLGSDAMRFAQLADAARVEVAADQ